MFCQRNIAQKPLTLYSFAQIFFVTTKCWLKPPQDWSLVVSRPVCQIWSSTFWLQGHQAVLKSGRRELKKHLFRVVFPIFRQPRVAKMIKSGKSNSAWPRRFQWHPTSLYLAPKVAQRAQKHLFRVVFPIFWQPWVAKMNKSGKSNSACPRRFQWHPTSLYLAPKVAQGAQKHLFRVVFPIVRQPWLAKMNKSGKSNSACPRRFQWHPTSLYLAPKVAQGAQKHLFRVVFPIVWQPWLAKMIKSGKSNSAWPRRF